MKMKRKYEYTEEGHCKEHIWSVVDDRIGMHLRILDTGNIAGKSGRVEIHHRNPPEYRRSDPPDHKSCWLLGGPCWHDGSSLWAETEWIPFARSCNHDKGRIFAKLERTAERIYREDQELDE